MTRNEIEEGVQEILVIAIADPKVKITGTLGFLIDLGFDHLEIGQLQMNLEDEFNISVTDAEITDAATVDGVIDLIEKKLAG